MRATMGLLALLAIAACEPGTPRKPRPAVAGVIAQIVPDRDMAAFFVEEAARARVASISLIHGGPGGDYGSTTMRSDTRAPAIRLNVDRPGGTSPTNLAHEISHSAVMLRGCYNHGERWLAYHLGIAERFEARFPGVKWSGTTPTANVAAKAARYPGDHC